MIAVLYMRTVAHNPKITIAITVLTKFVLQISQNSYKVTVSLSQS